jgi:hypothetical protein
MFPRVSRVINHSIGTYIDNLNILAIYSGAAGSIAGSVYAGYIIPQSPRYKYSSMEDKCSIVIAGASFGLVTGMITPLVAPVLVIPVTIGYGANRYFTKKSS